MTEFARLQSVKHCEEYVLKLQLSRFKKKRGDIFGKFQLGVNVQNGCGSIIHSLNQKLQENQFGQSAF